MDLYTILKKLQIAYEEVTHPAIFTAEEAMQIKDYMPKDATGCKNLFLSDPHGNEYVLAFLDERSRGDLKAIAREMNTARLHFASKEALQAVLGLTPGMVTPLALINDTTHKVKVYLDPTLKGKKVLMHPVGTNARSLAMNFSDLEKFIAYIKANG